MEPQTTTLKDGTQLDLKALKVMKAIREVESGGDYNAIGDNGNAKGAYQFNEKTGPGWKNLARTYLGDENAAFDKGNQNKVAYSRIKQWKDEGKQPDEIAALWNGATKDANGKYTYNKPEYGQKFRAALTGGQSNYVTSVDTPKQEAQTEQKLESPKSPYGAIGDSMQHFATGMGASLLGTAKWIGDKVGLKPTPFGEKLLSTAENLDQGIAKNVGKVAGYAAQAAPVIEGLAGLTSATRVLKNPVVKTALENIGIRGPEALGKLETKSQIFNALSQAVESASPYDKIVLTKQLQKLVQPSLLKRLLVGGLKNAGSFALGTGLGSEVQGFYNKVIK